MQRLGNALQLVGLIGFVVALYLASPVAMLAFVSLLIFGAGVIVERR